MTVKYIYYYRLCDDTVLSFNFNFHLTIIYATTKVILTIEEVISATSKVISATTKVISASEEVITATLIIMSADTKVILATEEITATLKNS